MFITATEVEAMKKAQNIDPANPSVFDMRVDYYFLTDNGKVVCGMPVYLLGMRHPENNGKGLPFFIDFMVKTPVTDVFTHFKNVKVVTLSIQPSKSDTTQLIPSVCKFDDAAEVIRIVSDHIRK